MPEALTAERVEEIFKDCLYRNEEIKDGKPPDGTVVIEGIVSKYGLHPSRLETHRQEVRQMLDELPDEFKIGTGAGWSFLNMCVRKDGVHWGEHPSMELLVCLGIGLGYVRYCLPREMWSALPGGVPYISVDLKEKGD